MALRIDTSGTLLLQQVGSDVQYKSVDDSSWTDISAGQWPVTLNNTYTANTLEVTFTTDLSLNSADQYFIIDSSNITIDGSDNTVNIDISGAGYPGLFQNGTYYYNEDGYMDASNNAYSDITIQNIIIDSHSSSLLAIAPTTSTTGSNEDKYGNGWLCQACYGLDGSTNSIDNCSSNGATVTSGYTYTIYWVDASGDTYSDNTNTTGGGCILGDFCDADATNCYSIGTKGNNAGGIFGSGSQGTASNCYSIGPISDTAGGIFGSVSQYGSSAINCYSTGPTIGSQGGGIFGIRSSGSATNCYSTGTIANEAGGIFGPISSGSATNCYSTGDIGSQGGGIFGQGGSGSATNCYSIGTTIGSGQGIGGQNPTNCYYTDGSANWSDASANEALDVSGTIVWTDIDLSANNVPYLLSSFTTTLYSPSTATDESNSGISVLTDCSFSIVSVNDENPSNYTGINIDENTGDISFNLLSLQNGVYEVNVLATNTIDGYSFGTFTNTLPTTIDASGLVLVKQDVGSDVQYSLDAGTNWTTAVWPVTLNNTYTANTLEVTFTTDLSLNSADQYFIIDSSNITIDGSDNTVNIDISGAGYPGLVRNGTYYYDGSGIITASNNAYSDITIQNIIIDSHSSSLLAIAPTTTTGSNDNKYENGWLCQAYYGLNGSTNSIDNCSSNGGTATLYWVASNGNQRSDNNGYTQGGCILGDFCSADVTNCYSTGTIDYYAGGIFGSYSDASANATNCYSTGNIGDFAGGIFGQLSSGSATNCYSTGPIGGEAGGIFGFNSTGSATNCYSIGTTIGIYAGGIFGANSQGSATNCYSIGPINVGAGGIFGFNSTGSATNCYSIGTTIGTYAGGIFGFSSQGSATNCYSTGNIGDFAGGIFGQLSSGSATNCYSTGPIGGGAGGIFGLASQSGASATNCYSTGDIGFAAGGIFGENSQGSAINCYSTGPIGGEAGGIFGLNSTGSATNCYSTDGSANWLDSAADASLNPLNAWTDIDLNSTNVPYLLSSFYTAQTLYDPSSGTNVVTEMADISGNYTWSITSVNGSTTNNEGITIDGSNGDISFGVSSNGTYAVNVLAVDPFGNYSFETFTNIISNICFPAGTPIVTNQGIIAIHKINPKIHTIRNKKIVAITKTVSPDKYLVRFEKDALGRNLPCEATTMTQNHMLFYKGEMMKAKEFLKTHNESVSKVPYNGQVLYNVLLEEHDKMVVNNLICETLHPENYVAKMYHAFKTLTPKQRVEMIKQVNKAVLTNDIYNKPTSKKFTFTVSK